MTTYQPLGHYTYETYTMRLTAWSTLAKAIGRLSDLGVLLLLGVAVNTAWHGRLAFISRTQADASLLYLTDPFSRIIFWLFALIGPYFLLQNPPLNRFVRRMFLLSSFYSASMGCISEYYRSPAPFWARWAVVISSLVLQAASVGIVVAELRCQSDKN